MEFNEIKSKLISFLTNEKEVPRDAIKTDLVFSNQMESSVSFYVPHLAIIDNEILCIFVIDDGKNRVLNNFIKIHLNSINAFIKKKTIIYLVDHYKESIRFFKISDTEEPVEIKSADFPSYEGMKDDTIILQYLRIKEIENERNVLENEKIGTVKKETKFAFFLIILVTIPSLLSVLLYYTESDNTRIYSTNNEKNSIGYYIDSISDVINKVKSQTVLLKNKDTVFVNTSLYQSLNQRIKVIENGISDNPQKTLSNIKLENRINELQFHINNLRDVSNLRYETLNSNVSLVSNLIISLYTGLIICILGWLLTFLYKNRK